MSNLNDMLVKGLLTRANARLDEGQWKDITNLFSEINYTSFVHNLGSSFGRDDVKAKGVFRVYLETLNGGLGETPERQSFVGNARVFMFTIDTNYSSNGYFMSFSTNTISTSVPGTYIGSLLIRSSSVYGLDLAYNYGNEIATSRKPRIFKIERLIENE